MSSTTNADLHGLIGQIYDCVLQPERWEHVLAALCHRLEMLHGVIGYYNAISGRPLLRIQHGMAAEWFDRMPQLGAEMASYWGGHDRIQGYPLGEVIVHSVANPDIDARNNRFAREWCAPQGIVDMAAMTISGDQHGVGTLVFTSRRLIAPDGADDIDVLRLLSPHVRRAITISRIFELRAIEIRGLRAALDVMPNGIILVDHARCVVYSNAAAQAIMRANDAIGVSDGVVTMRQAHLDHALRDAVTRMVPGPVLSEKGSGIAAIGSTGARCMIRVLPLDYGTIKLAVDSRAAAALVITSEGGTAERSAEALRLRFDLTPSERRICELVADGLSPGEIATRVGIAASTVRSHLHNIFAKTGTRRQADIVRLMADLRRD